MSKFYYNIISTSFYLVAAFGMTIVIAVLVIAAD